MPSNTISNRVAEFLSQFPPFDLATTEELKHIAEHVQIQYLEANEKIFTQGNKPGDFFFVVRQGSVRIFDEANTLIDICDDGDIFGVRPLLANQPYLASAEAQEECLLYAIPVSVGRDVLQSNGKVSLFFAMGYASGKPMQRFHQRKQNETIKSEGNNEGLPIISESSTVNTAKTVLTCKPTLDIKGAAQLMTERGVGSIIIADEENKPLGIVTDKDLRVNVATGNKSVTEPITTIMNSPVFCAEPDLSVAEYMIEMVGRGVHHLCITTDGTVKTALTGILSDHDLLLEQGFNPAILIKEIRKSRSITPLLSLRNKADELLNKYIEQEISMDYISRMMAGVNNALLTKIIDVTINKVGEPPCGFAWLSLGSQGREEQLLRTDQDHALVFADGKDEATDRKNQDYFLTLAEQVAQQLERFGFEQDVADIGANREKWCQPLHKWKSYFTSWVKQPAEDNILQSTIFFDFRPAYGDESLAREMASHLFSALEKKQTFLPHLAKNAMANPAPLSFFRNFVVENSGEHKDQFDLKLRAMLPLVDAARVLILQNHVTGINNTIARFKHLAKIDEPNSELLENAAEGYGFLVMLRARFGLEQNSSGRYINPDDLSKLERQILRTIFNTINELQKLLQVRFQTGYLG